MTYTLRQATQEDAKLLFDIKIDAMMPVHNLLYPNEVFNYEEKYKKHLEKFVPSEIKVIQYEGKDVGRIRIENLHNSIYIGGFQILPAYHSKGIGTEVMKDIISATKKNNLCVTLEVHEVNERALSFYKKLGFVENGIIDGKIKMIYK